MGMVYSLYVFWCWVDISIYLVYTWYIPGINCRYQFIPGIYLVCTVYILIFLFHSRESQQRQDSREQGLCLAFAWNDASHFKVCNSFPDRWVEGQSACAAVSLLYRHPFNKNKRPRRTRRVHKVCRQYDTPFPCFPGLFMYGRWWGLYCNNVSHYTVHYMLVPPRVIGFDERHFPFSWYSWGVQWVASGTWTAAWSRRDASWSMQGKGIRYIDSILVIWRLHSIYILTLFLSYNYFIPSIYQLFFFGQVKDAKQRLRHKVFPPNAWMKTLHSTWSSSAPLRICAWI